MSRIDNFGDKRASGQTEHNRAARWVKGGPSPNPGGKPKIAHILEAIGKSTDQARIELVRTAWEWMEDPKASDKSRTYAHKFLCDFVGLIFKQQIEISGAVSPEALSMLDALKLTTIERRREIEAQDATLPPTDAG